MATNYKGEVYFSNILFKKRRKMMNTVNITIDEKPIKAEKGSTNYGGSFS